MKKDNILKLKKALRDEKQRADKNYVAYDRIRNKYADLVLRMRQVRNHTRTIDTFVQEMKSRLRGVDEDTSS